MEETVNMEEAYLVGGFNPFEKYESKWVHLPNFRGEHKQIVELPPTKSCLFII